MRHTLTVDEMDGFTFLTLGENGALRKCVSACVSSFFSFFRFKIISPDITQRCVDDVT